MRLPKWSFQLRVFLALCLPFATPLAQLHAGDEPRLYPDEALGRFLDLEKSLHSLARLQTREARLQQFSAWGIFRNSESNPHLPKSLQFDVARRREFEQRIRKLADEIVGSQSQIFTAYEMEKWVTARARSYGILESQEYQVTVDGMTQLKSSAEIRETLAKLGVQRDILLKTLAVCPYMDAIREELYKPFQSEFLRNPSVTREVEDEIDVQLLSLYLDLLAETQKRTQFQVIELIQATFDLSSKVSQAKTQTGSRPCPGLGPVSIASTRSGSSSSRKAADELRQKEGELAVLVARSAQLATVLKRLDEDRENAVKALDVTTTNLRHQQSFLNQVQAHSTGPRLLRLISDCLSQLAPKTNGS
jgi:hypothetical protein